MVISLSGDNWFLIRAEIDRLVAEFSQTNDPLGVEKLDSQSLSYEELRQSLSSYSLLSRSRLVILVEPSKIKQFSDNIAELIEDLPDTTSLVIVEPSLDKRLSYYKFLVSNTDFKSQNKLAGPQLIDWVISFTKDLGGGLNRQQALHLVDRVGDDQMLLSNEIAKLVLYSKQLTVDSIDLLTEQSAASTIFQLLDAAFSDRPKLALSLYNDQRLQKVEPEQVLSMMSWQVQALAICMASKNMSPSEVASLSKLSPFTVQKAKQVAAKLSFSSLKRMVSELSLMDQRSKTESFNLDEGLKNFIVGLNNPS